MFIVMTSQVLKLAISKNVFVTVFNMHLRIYRDI